MSAHLLATVIFFAYLALTLILGWWGRRNMQGSTIQEYYTAGKRIGPWLGMITYGASNWSTFTFLGSVGIYYSHGIGYAALPVGEMFFMGILFPTLGYKIWKFSRAPEVITLTDIVARRYEEDHLVRALYALANIIFMFFLMGVQIVGVSYVIEKVTGGIIPYLAAALIVATVLIIYQTLGGMRSVVYTDVLQLTLLTLTLVTVFVAIVVNFDMASVFQRVSAGPKAGILSAPGPRGIWSPTYWTTAFIAFGFGWFFAWFVLYFFHLAEKKNK